MQTVLLVDGGGRTPAEIGNILTGEGYNVLTALDVAVDDLALEFDEIAVRIKNALAVKRVVTEHITVGPFTANTGPRTVAMDGITLPLTSKEFDLLLFFMQNPGRVFTKEMLYTNIWDADFDGDTRTVMVYISRLRKKIEKTPEKPELLLNVWGVGYKLNCEE
ncbi:MAG: response regulator transcription factor [Oscillospiraceae bacterium]|jgi:DNA-binding response OmpR family regulator|nr:response regulator transcription factor [Oscillospiraceae bacterium]